MVAEAPSSTTVVLRLVFYVVDFVDATGTVAS